MRDEGPASGWSRDADAVEGVDGLAGGLHAQTVCQVEGLDGIVKRGRAVVGCTSGMGQSVRVNSGYRAILVVDVGGKFSVLGALTTSARLLAAMVVAASLSLGRSVSAATAVGPALLLLLGELWVRLLALHSAKLVGLWGLTASAARRSEERRVGKECSS